MIKDMTMLIGPLDSLCQKLQEAFTFLISIKLIHADFSEQVWKLACPHLFEHMLYHMYEHMCDHMLEHMYKHMLEHMF